MNNSEDTPSNRDKNEENKEEERAKWDKPIEFVLSCLGYAVGLGNVWRFPYLCYRNGGGVFVFVYLLMVILMGMPIFFLELILGQYTAQGAVEVFESIAPILGGLGICTLVVITIVTIYYMVILAWVLFYLFASFIPELGWGSCNNDFNTPGCYSVLEDDKCFAANANTTYFQKTCVDVQELCESFGFASAVNRTFCADAAGNAVHMSTVAQRTLATEEYFNNFVLQKDDATWENYGGLSWQLVLCLLLAWIICYGCVIKGVKSAGKAVYFTALFPYVVLTALVVRGLTLDGFEDGLILYLKPDWSKLGDVQIWGSAASQTFYSFGISCGSLITLASYNNFQNNCHRDVLIVSLTNAFTSLYAGLAVFSMLGFLANSMDLPVTSVAKDGPGLTFVIYPEALLRMPGSNIWAVLFFIMLFTLGLGSQFAGVEAVSTFILDRWPHLRKKHIFVTMGICICCFLLALPMCCKGGIYMFSLLEWNTASWAILWIGIAEVGVVAWAYGADRFVQNVNEMGIKLKRYTGLYWKIMWIFVTPAILLGVFIFQMVYWEDSQYEGYVFPSYAQAIGILVGLSTVMPLPIVAGYKLYEAKYSGWEYFKATDNWRPATLKGKISTSQNISTISIETKQ